MELSALQIRILFKCSEKPLSKRNITQLYHRYLKAERDTAIQQLLEKKLLTAQELPKPGANKTPTFYKITSEGIAWLEQYKLAYPK